MNNDVNLGPALSLFTFIMEYRGGTYISQVMCEDKERACILWVDQLHIEEIKGFGKKTKGKLLKGLEEEDLIAIDTCTNIWLFCVRVKKKLAFIHVIKTAF